MSAAKIDQAIATVSLHSSDTELPIFRNVLSVHR